VGDHGESCLACRATISQPLLHGLRCVTIFWKTEVYVDSISGELCLLMSSDRRWWLASVESVCGGVAWTSRTLRRSGEASSSSCMCVPPAFASLLQRLPPEDDDANSIVLRCMNAVRRTLSSYHDALRFLLCSRRRWKPRRQAQSTRARLGHDPQASIRCIPRTKTDRVRATRPYVSTKTWNRRSKLSE